DADLKLYARWRDCGGVPREGLVAEYLFNGNANDTSGKDNNGNVQGAQDTTDRFGLPGRALDFKSCSQYVLVPDSPTLKFSSGVTVSAWVCRRSGTYILSKDDPSGGSNLGLMLDWWAVNPSPAFVVTPKTEPASGAWHHVVGTYDGLTSRLFIDGVEQGSLAASFPLQSNSNPLVIGQKNYAPDLGTAGNYWFDGAIDDVRIYNRALGEREIDALYHEGGWEDGVPRAIAWTVSTASPVLNEGGAPWDTSPGQGLGWGISAVKVGSAYRLFLGGRNASAVQIQIGQAVSGDGVNWSLVPGPLPDGELFRDDRGANWNVDNPSVLYDGTSYRMWYAQDNNGWACYNLRSSTDGVNWTEVGQVLGYSAGSGTFATTQCGFFSRCSVLFDAGTYRMWYVGFDGLRYRVGLATSSDGVNWTRVNGAGTGGSCLDTGAPGQFDSEMIIYPCVIKDRNGYSMWYCGSDGSTNGLGWATSPDGLVWTKRGVVDLDGLDVRRASVISDGSIYRMWFEYYDGTRTRIGYATGH
ncbi:MAG TPA: LamG-like jellyroll fold domain-containing protein, partial [Spirochaetia bacterium]|nr:LamG-like jellyroll fold domain-containing protein [Spirochaetia bacterium]